MFSLPGRARSGRPLGAIVAAVVSLLLVFAGLQASPAFAGVNDFGLSVKNGGVTTVSSYTDVVPFEVQISLPSGTTVQAGAVTKLTLDNSLKRTNNGALPVGATAQTWDEQSNTLTVTWGVLYSGTVYAASVNANPSATATIASTLTATAVTTGTSTTSVALVQTATSQAVAAGGTIAATLAPVTPGSWTLAAPSTITGYPGTTPATTYPVFSPVGARTSFRNLQVVTDWTSSAPGDQLMPRSWSATGPAMMNTVGQGQSYTTVQNDANTSIRAYGAWNISQQMPFGVVIPAGTAPGTYSVLYSVQDDADASGTTKIVAYSGVYKVVVQAPVAAVLAFDAAKGSTQVVPGGLFDWNHRLNATAPAGKITDFTVVAPIPPQAILRGISGGFKSTASTFPIKSVEYTTDSVLAAASWQPLPMNGNAVSLPDPSVITAIRYSIADINTVVNSPLQGVGLTLQARNELTVGSSVNLGVASVTYVDPTDVSTVLSLAPDSGFSKAVAVVATPADPSPRIAAGNSANSYNGDDFNKTYSNGNSLGFLGHVGSDALTPTEQPYIFAITPKGVTSTLNSPQTCSSYAWLTFESCSRGIPISYPKTSFGSGSVQLSDGSTLSYARVTSGQISGGRDGLTEFIAAGGIQVRSALAGKQTVLLGMGSSTQNSFTVSPLNTTVSPAGAAPFAQKSLADPSSFGPYQGVGAEALAALQAAGISTTNSLVGERYFSVSPSTSVGSSTTIKGSEDAAGIVQGAGTATARPGGSVNYQVDVSNTGSTIYQDFQFIDVLPAVGDAFTLNSGAQRGSAFDVNLSGNVSVLVNGVPSSGAVVEYSTSGSPQRFDAAGADVAGAAWLPYTGAATGAKALRVTLAAGVEFAPGDKITLSFDATVPASAPRDGSTAKNTVAYRFKSDAGVWVAAEAPAVPVKSSAPAGDTQLSGQAFLDLNTNGVQDAGEPGLNGAGVSLQLYKMVSGSPVVVGSPVTPNTDASVDGVFSFIGLDPNQTYRVKPVSSNTNVTFPASAIDADGFLTYAQVTDATVNGTENTSQYVGSSSFKVGDEVGVKKWIKDLRLPLVAKTTVSGSLQLTNTANTPIGAGVGSAAAPFVKDYTVKLMQGTTEKGSVTTTESGVFSFTGLEGLAPGNYSLLFVAPSGAQLVGSALNNVSVFSGAVTAGADGTYALNGLQPGTGATGVSVYYTDTQVPVSAAASLQGGVSVAAVKVNPSAAVLTASDVGTAVVQHSWKIVDVSSVTVASGTALGAAPSVTIPAGLADGGYRVVSSASDVVGNTSGESSVVFAVDKTAPTVSTTAPAVTYAKGSPAVPTTAQGWMTLFGVTAADAGVGMPATGGVTVDASAVNPTTAGTYTVTFTGTDAAGNAATPVAVTYTVAYVGDPTITLGRTAANYEMGAAHPATDAVWKALFNGVTTTTGAGASVASVTVDSAAVDYTVQGTYPVIFTVTDSLGYTATVTGQLTVQDTTKPVLTTTNTDVTFTQGGSPVTTDAGWIAAYGVAASDAGSGMPTTALNGITVSQSVDYATAGSYPVVFTATDNAGNISTVQVTYVVAFAGAPTVTLGNAQVVFEMGATRPATTAEWVALFNAQASSAPGTTLQPWTVDSSAVNFATASAIGYDVKFTATDSFGNTFTATGKFVVQDTTAPVAVVGTAVVKHRMEAPVVAWTAAEWVALFGVTATDPDGTGVDGDNWSVTQGVNFGVAGEYAVSFVAHDGAGNASKAVVATLTIQAPPSATDVTTSIPQNKSVVLDPIGSARTTGTLTALTAADLGAPSQGGTAEISGGQVQYTPAQGFFGEETLQITVTDDLGQTAQLLYSFNVVKAGEIIPGSLPEYNVPVDGALTVPLADVVAAVDTQGLDLDAVQSPSGFVGTVAISNGDIVFTTDGTSWSGDETFTVTVKDTLGQAVEVPVLLHVLAPSLSVDAVSGYAGKTTVTISAAGLVPGKTYAIELHSTPLPVGSFTAAADGTAQLSALLPAVSEVGSHQLTLLNDRAQVRAQVGYTVLDETVPGGGGTAGNDTKVQGNKVALSETGSAQDLFTMTMLGVLVMLSGAALVIGTRRRRGAESRTP